MSYLSILLILFFFFLLLQIKFEIKLYHSWKQRILIPGFYFLIGVIWDGYAIQNQHWSFSQEQLIGYKLWVIPLEEYLFFLIIPYCILVSYKLLKKYSS